LFAFLSHSAQVAAETDSGVEVENRRDSSVPIADQDSFDDLDDDFSAIGTARALYKFDGESSYTLHL
jgi:hypothetical protein